MGKGDKRLLALAIALISLAMVWFAQFSQAQQNAIYTDSIVQILDATKTAHGEPMALKIPPPSARRIYGLGG
ncbi:hypothetical protein DSCA_27470 [Desulfosarcina alkanivorans]|jgi:hypothetical protein|uniref:Uncharacterized protein n=1 Tax=Desulfosarcina alkanivorans TaxID=571177 RepID=A0A5K7YVX5_9BACT|nr:hypothetical protein [Desulfosarcina alkanivorans]BBO68817.1 hypothetical protein DSCA_27470 [Desulfosarcina alkanivorans]